MADVKYFYCNISKELMQRVKLLNVKYAWIVEKGVEAISGKSDLNGDIRDMQLTIEKQSKAINRLQGYINDLQMNDLQIKESINKDKIEHKEV